MKNVVVESTGLSPIFLLGLPGCFDAAAPCPRALSHFRNSLEPALELLSSSARAPFEFPFSSPRLPLAHSSDFRRTPLYLPSSSCRVSFQLPSSSLFLALTLSAGSFRAPFQFLPSSVLAPCELPSSSPRPPFERRPLPRARLDLAGRARLDLIGACTRASRLAGNVSPLHEDGGWKEYCQ